MGHGVSPVRQLDPPGLEAIETENPRSSENTQLSDLRDSCFIEQDADIVLLQRRPCRIPGDQQSSEKTLAIVDVAKNRNGETGEINLHVTDQCTRFDNRISADGK